MHPGKQIPLSALALLATSTAVAHHSQVQFDMSRCLTIQGTVRTFQFQFPHSWLWVVVPNTRGEDDVWGFESSAPVNMKEIEPRWARNIVNKGDKVTVRYSPMKDGRHGGALGTLALPDGSVLRAATPACSGEKRSPPPATPAPTQPR